MSEIMKIRKRSWDLENYDLDKIVRAIYKSLESVWNKNLDDAKKIADSVHKKLTEECCQNQDDCTPTVEHIEDTTEKEMMSNWFYEAAKSYIIYRENKKNERKRDIFKKRVNLKPYEYPELLEYKDAIRNSYWLHTEFNFTSDIQDFHTISETEKNAIKNTMLAIAQIEVAVKTFWASIFNRLPKPEIGAVWDTFAESEVRHMDAYSHLLEILGLNWDFEKITEIPAIQQRIDYLWEATEWSKVNSNRNYTKNILLFSLFVEHVSLFSQFLIMMAFNKHKNIFKWVSNVVEATSKEEQIHWLFGIQIINIIKEEHPEWFDAELIESIKKSCRKSLEAEEAILDWIFEKWELEFLRKRTIIEFIKNRFNNSLESIWVERIFEVDQDELDKTEWFDDEIMTTKHGDFFVKRSINYNKKSQSMTWDDLF